jgi:hypothetical protein
VKCRVVRATKMTGSNSDNWIYWHFGYTLSLNHSQYSDITDLHTLQFTVAHALGVSIFTNGLLATDLNTETSNLNHYEVFLLFRLQLLWNSTALCWTQNWTSHGCLLRRTHLNGTAPKTGNCYVYMCNCRYIASAPITHGKRSPIIAQGRPQRKRVTW